MKKKIFTKSIYLFLSLLLALGAFATVPGGAVSADINQVYPALTAGADRLVDLQNIDGGWDWPLDNGDPNTGSALNTIGPIAKGLAEAYNRTGSSEHKEALELAGTLLLSKTVFSTSDGYLAAQLDTIFGVTTYTDYVKANFYDKLAAGTYDRSGTLYDTAAYVASIRTNRANQGIPNLAAWDVGMGLVGAAFCGADTTEWIAGTKAEIDELDGGTESAPLSYDVIGLAGAVYGLAVVGEDFDPTAGDFASDASLADLADSLAGYQLNSGGFAWNKNYVIEADANEDVQATAYAILALNEVDRALYLDDLFAAADYLMSVQLPTGGWDNYPAFGSYPASGENNEVTAEALWGISTAYMAYPEVWVCETGDCGHPEASFNVLQDGINNVALDGIVHVLAATYTENVSVGKSVTVLGEGVDHSSIISGLMTIDAEDVVLDGFTITNPDQPNAIVIKSTSTTIDLTNNIFELIGNDVLTSNVQAIYLQHGPDDILIEGNIFRNIHSGTKSVKPVFIGDSNTTDPSEDVIIRDNQFENITSGSYGAYAILTNNGAGSTGLVIEGNQFSTISGLWARAIGLEGPTPNAIVTENVISGLTHTGSFASGVYFEDNSDGGSVNVEYNQFNGTGYAGIAIHPDDHAGGANGFAYTVDGEFNWWGSDAGPDLTTGIYGDVDYSPWLGFVPGTSPMTFHTNDNIQDAIDEAVSGDTVMVKDGTYTENLVIYKDLTVMGEGLDTIVQAPEDFSKCFTTSYDAYPVVCVQDAEVSIDSLTVDGAGHGNANYKFMGVAYRNAGGAVQNAQIIGIENTPFSGAQHGVGMYVFNDDTVERTFTIDNVLITDFQKNAMALNASADTLLTVSVLNNEIVGHGVTAITAQNGIQVYGDLITGTIENNVVRGIGYDNTDAVTKWVATSILNYYADIDVIGNTITEAQVALYNIDGGGRFANNEIEVNKIGVSGYGMILTDPPAAVPSPFVEEASLVLNQTKSTAKSETENVVVLENNAVIFVGADNAGTIGIEADAGYDVKDMDVTLNQNTVMGFDYGIVLSQYVADDASDAVFTNLAVNFNRIVDNTVGLYSDVAYMSVNAENNWWGCNEGPGAPDCDPIDGTGAVDADPWIVLSMTADPEELEPGMSSDLEANLVMNSAGASTAALGYIPQGLLVTFTAPDGGVLNPASGLTVNSAVATVFTPPEIHGDYDVCAAVDNEVVCPVVTVVGPGAVDDTYTTEEDTTLVVAAPGVLTNDTGIEHVGYAVALWVEPLHGQVTLNADGSFTYVPNPGFVGEDTFEYQLVTHPNDAKSGWTDEAVVTITVTPGIPVTGDTFIYLPFIVR